MRLIFDLVGGPLDGESLVGFTGQQPKSWQEQVAIAYYDQSGNGAVGKHIYVQSDYLIQLMVDDRPDITERLNDQPVHSYEITERLHEGGDLLIPAEHRPNVKLS